MGYPESVLAKNKGGVAFQAGVPPSSRRDGNAPASPRVLERNPGQYPSSVLTVNKKGETEVRRLLGKGVFVKYDYIYPETGKQAENGKTSIILKFQKRPTAQTKQVLPEEQSSPVTDINNQSGEEHYFLIPIKGERFLAVKPKEAKEEKPDRKFWDEGKKKAVGFD